MQDFTQDHKSNSLLSSCGQMKIFYMETNLSTMINVMVFVQSIMLRFYLNDIIERSEGYIFHFSLQYSGEKKIFSYGHFTNQ